LHETNKRHIPFSTRRFGHRLHSRRFGECLRTVPGTASARRVHGLDKSRTPQFIQGDCVARGTLGGSKVDELLIPMVAAMRRELISGSYIQADETPVDVQNLSV